VAVDGFFVISGYLICRSRVKGGPGGGRAYLWKRFLRIVPGYWVCLVVTAFIVSPIAWAHEYGSLHNFVSLKADGPVRFVVQNMSFLSRQSSIAGVFGGSHMPGAVNGSIWTLFYEVAAYVGIALLAWVRLLRHRPWVAPAFPGALLGVLAYCDLSSPRLQSGVIHDGSRLGLFFAIGMSFYLWERWVPVSGWVAAATAALWLASPWLVGPGLARDWQLLGAVPFAYLVLWLAIRLPLARVGRKADLSYGTYLYAWPVQQLLTMWGVPSRGWVTYSLLSIAASTALAVASWHLVESPMLKHKRSVASPKEVAAIVPAPGWPLPVLAGLRRSRNPMCVPGKASSGPALASMPAVTDRREGDGQLTSGEDR
jgi:peptidoglycan/LPS O-acetylase OafA/YrhL